MIRLHDLTKSYRSHGVTHHVLDKVNETFNQGDSVGILGRNGAGKSTLLKIIAGVMPPSSGRVERQMSVSWPLGYHSALHSSLTGADNARFLARIYDCDIDATLAYVENFAELGKHFHLPVRTYSAGMVLRLSFGLFFAFNFNCYLLDEVTTAGDARFTARCREALEERRERSTLLLVSHIPDVVRMYCSAAAVLHEGRLIRYDCIDDAIAAYHAL